MRIAMIGDIGFFGKNSITTNQSIFDYFINAKNYFDKFDYVVGNLELPFLENGTAYGSKSANLKSHPENIALLKYLNINIVSLANNHIFDFGQAGVDSTTKLLNENKIMYFGINKKDLILEDAGLALHGYCCYSTNPYGLGGVVNKLNVVDIADKIKNFHDRGYLSLVSIHSGQEHINYPAFHDILAARKWSDICPYIYHGHHPHVLQCVEELNDSLIAYSLGNFCFDDVYTKKSKKPLIAMSENNKTTAAVELNIENGHLISHKIVDMYLGPEKMEVGETGFSTNMNKYALDQNIDKEAYNKRRGKLISEYLKTRKSDRNVEWYLSRMNVKSIKMIIRAFYNNLQHKKNVLAHLK